MISWVYIPFKTLVTLEPKELTLVAFLVCGCIKIFVKHMLYL